MVNGLSKNKAALNGGRARGFDSTLTANGGEGAVQSLGGDDLLEDTTLCRTNRMN
jgi:hypothetical protein